VLIIISTWY